MNDDLQGKFIDAALAEADKADAVGSAMEKKAATVLASESALEVWKKTVYAIVRKAKGLKPEDEVELPHGGTGTYIRYAFDNRGQLSLGKRHGRRRQRGKIEVINRRREFVGLSQRLFGVYLQSEFKKATKKHKLDVEAANGSPAPEMPSITQEIFNKSQKWATQKSAQLLKQRDDVGRKAARQRRDVSRRINSGTLAGNSDRRSHARP